MNEAGRARGDNTRCFNALERRASEWSVDYHYAREIMYLMRHRKDRYTLPPWGSGPSRRVYCSRASSINRVSRIFLVHCPWWASRCPETLDPFGLLVRAWTNPVRGTSAPSGCRLHFMAAQCNRFLFVHPHSHPPSSTAARGTTTSIIRFPSFFRLDTFARPRVISSLDPRTAKTVNSHGAESEKCRSKRAGKLNLSRPRRVRVDIYLRICYRCDLRSVL